MELTFLCKYTGGSTLYGLRTENSDVDQRGVFVNTTASFILGLDQMDQQTINNKEIDLQYVELKYLLKLMSMGKMNALEPIWVDRTKLDFCDYRFDELRKNRMKLLDTESTFKSLRGFMLSQKNLTFNEGKTADEGSQRAEAVAKYGYYPKAAVHTIRLAESGMTLFKLGVYRVAPIDNRELCMAIKTNPFCINGEEMRKLLNDLDNKVEEAYTNRVLDKKFDRDLANDFLRLTYLPYLTG